MNITFEEEVLDISYTFNSFKYMEDLNFGDLENLDKTPFKLIGIVKILLMGGLNHRSTKQYNGIRVDSIIEDVLENGDIIELLTDLISELEKSSFFKNLQGNKTKK